MVPLSVLDLSPITEGSDAGQALRNSLDLRHVEALGYRRFWMAEHHNLPGIASAATAVALAHVAAGTSQIRIGAGGIMLPNHAPLLIAEQFGTLAALHPGRVELGLGRAPGSDQITARAMRRNLLGGDVESFPQEVVELMSYFRPAEPGQAVQAVPGAGLEVPLWILGSSLYGAQVAAYLGLPFAFASHFAPAMMMPAMKIYRERFRPSGSSPLPHVMLGVVVVAAESDEEARFLFSSLQQSSLNNRTGRRGRVPPPVANFEARLDPYARAILDDALGCADRRRPRHRAPRPRRFHPPHRRRRADGDRQHLRPRQAQTLLRDRRRAAWRDEDPQRSRRFSPRRPVVNPRQAVAHQLGAIAVRQPVGDAERLDPLLVGQQRDRAGPVGAPHAAVEAKGVEDAAERIPDVLVWERLVRQGAGAADLDRDVGVRGQRQHLRQFGKGLRRRRRRGRLLQPEMVDHQLRVGVARRQLARLLQTPAYTPS